MPATESRQESYGQAGLTPVDRLGVYLSRRAIARELPQLPGQVLDLGCGYDAPLLNWLTERGFRGTGIDVSFSPETLANPQLTTLEGVIEERLDELPPGSFQCIFAISVLEHIWQPEGIIAKAHELLEPGGKLVVNVPTWLGRYALEFSAFKLSFSPKLEMDDHKSYYNKRNLWPLLRAAGFLPSDMTLRYHKFGLNLFAVAQRTA